MIDQFRDEFNRGYLVGVREVGLVGCCTVDVVPNSNWQSVLENSLADHNSSDHLNDHYLAGAAYSVGVISGLVSMAAKLAVAEKSIYFLEGFFNTAVLSDPKSLSYRTGKLTAKFGKKLIE